MEYSKKKRKIDKTEKQIVGIFAFLGLAAIILGFLQLRHNLAVPFDPYRTDYNKLTSKQEQTEQILALRAKDSDADGLTDYDELFEYSTSPYIVDSDSDGFSDKEEIDNNENPNCPQGQQCSVGSEEDDDTAEETVNLADLSTEQLRNILKANGVPQTTLDSLDDETLQSYYQEFLAESSLDVGSKYSSNDNSNTNNINDDYTDLLSENINGWQGITSEEDLANLSAEEIRDFLIQAGEFDEETLNQIDDEQLKSIFLESLQN